MHTGESAPPPDVGDTRANRPVFDEVLLQGNPDVTEIVPVRHGQQLREIGNSEHLPPGRTALDELGADVLRKT